METLSFSIHVGPNELLNKQVWKYLVKARADWTCEGCGSKDKLQAHHVNHNGKDHVLSNGRCLCHTCHVKEHSTLSPERREQNREYALQQWDLLSVEERTERARRGWETRRKKEAAA